MNELYCAVHLNTRRFKDNYKISSVKPNAVNIVTCKPDQSHLLF